MDIEIMPDKKYLIIGGYIISKTDRQTHYINAHMLRRLYNLPMSKCFLAESHDKILIESALHSEPKLIILSPRYDGNYMLEEKGNIASTESWVKSNTRITNERSS